MKLAARRKPRSSCPLCREELEPAVDTIQACEGCTTEYHAECLFELGGCATLGCAKKGQALESPEQESESIYDEVLDALRARRVEDADIRDPTPEELARREEVRFQLAERHRKRREEWRARKQRYALSDKRSNQCGCSVIALMLFAGSVAGFNAGHVGVAIFGGLGAAFMLFYAWIVMEEQ